PLDDPDAVRHLDHFLRDHPVAARRLSQLVRRSVARARRPTRRCRPRIVARTVRTRPADLCAVLEVGQRDRAARRLWALLRMAAARLKFDLGTLGPDRLYLTPYHPCHLGHRYSGWCVRRHPPIFFPRLFDEL